MKRTVLSTLVALMLGATAAMAQDALRPEVATPLRAAQDLMKNGKNKEALAHLREAEAVANRSPYEEYTLERIRGGIAIALGDYDAAVKSFEAVLASGRINGNEQLQLIESLAGMSFRAKNYPKAIELAQRYFAQGGSSETMRSLQVNAHYLSGDFAGVASSLQAKVDATEQATPTIDEQTLLLLASSYQKLNNEPGYVATLERLLVHHPKKAYWLDLVQRVQHKPGFANRLSLDAYRLLQATDNLNETEQFVEMAQLAIEAGYPAEAKKVLDAGFAASKLGKGAEANRHKRLQDMASKQIAEDEKQTRTATIGRSPDALINVGQWLVSMGQLDKGIEAMEQGLAKGALKRPEDAKLHLGMAYLTNGNKVKAAAVLKTVKGAEGQAELARLWLILARPVV